MKKFLQLAILATIAAPSLVFAVGAIAVDDVEGDKAGDVGYWFVTGEDSEAAAKKAALKGCKKAGMENCQIGVWFTKCGAYASSKKYSGYGTGKTKQIAIDKALDSCGDKGCKIVVAECED